MFDAATAGDYYRQGMSSLMTIADLSAAVGGLTQTSKMPWLSYSLSAESCKTGSKLRKIPGSVCSKCYACKGLYRLPSTKAAQAVRLGILLDDVDRWAGYMAALIKRKAVKIVDNRQYFRWHDSGDIQNTDHYIAIVWIARMVRCVNFYLPTKERRYHTFGSYDVRVPPNLVIRYSMPMIGHHAPIPRPIRCYATVGCKCSDYFQCPAKQQDGQCKDCRACWDRGKTVINYTQH